MKLRARPRRSTLNRSQLCCIFLIMLFSLGFYFTKREGITVNVYEIYADSLEEIQLVKSNRFNELLQTIEETDISLASKVKPGREREELINRLQQDNHEKQILLSLLVRIKNDEKRKFIVVEPKKEVEVVLQTEDLFSQVLEGLSEGDQQRISSQMSMDTENKWKPIPDWALTYLERDGMNPLNRDCKQYYSGDHGKRYGGLTADCGWIIMNSMHALENSACVEFSDLWGHGCDEEGRLEGWTCFFKPIQEGSNTEYSSSKVIKFVSGSQEDRRKVRRDELFTNGVTGHRYPILNGLINDNRKSEEEKFFLDRDADLLAWRLAFRWTFRPNDKVRAKLDEIQKRVLEGYNPEQIASAHLRFGDKLGLRPGPREAYLVYGVKDFAHRLVLYYKNLGKPFPKAVFVATDDYNASMELGRLLGKSVRVLTSAEPKRDQGFSIVEYRNQWSSKTRFDAAVRLWADMEILAKADVFLGSFQSNVGRTVHLMRFNKPASSTISVDPTSPRCSKKNRANQLSSHNFWLCP